MTSPPTARPREVHDVVFESTRSFSPGEFASFVAERERQGDRGHYELLNGRILMNPPAGNPHGEIGSAIQHLLTTFVFARELGRVFDASQGFHLPTDDVVEPDHSFVSRERWEAAAPPEEGSFLRVVPDLVVEALSTRTASQDRGERRAIYERSGVREYWLVDPRARELVVFRLDGEHFDAGRVHAEDEACASSVLAGLEFPVAALLPT